MFKFLTLSLLALVSHSVYSKTTEISLGSVRIENYQSDLEIKDFENLCQVISVRAVARKEKAELDWLEVNFREPVTAEHFRLNLTLHKDQATPALHLRGRGRCIDRIVMSARSRGSVWKDSKIELFATVEFRPQPPRPAPYITQPNGRDLTLVAETSLDQTMRSYFPTQAGQECGIEAVKIQSLSEASFLYRVSLQFDDGSTQDLGHPARFERNTETPWLRLPIDRWGRTPRCIRGFLIDGRSESYGPFPARIRIIGLRPR